MTEKAAVSLEKCFEAVVVAWHKTNKKVASRTRQQLCNIMRYAGQQDLTENKPALHLEGVTVVDHKILNQFA